MRGARGAARRRAAHEHRRDSRAAAPRLARRARARARRRRLPLLGDRRRAPVPAGPDRAAPLGAALGDPLARSTTCFRPSGCSRTLERVDPIGVFLGPPAIVPPPDRALARDPDVVRASKSVVRVTGIACGLGVEGSGWIARPGLVVTNAHVVAGIERPRVDTAGRQRRSRRRSSRSTRRTISPCCGSPGSAVGRSRSPSRSAARRSRSSATRGTAR